VKSGEAWAAIAKSPISLYNTKSYGTGKTRNQLIGNNGTPEKITIDKSGANTAAIESHNAETKAGIEMCQIKYLNSIVEQDHRAIKRRTRPMLGFKSFWSAAVTLAGVELMHMIRKGQLMLTGELCPAHQFYSLAE
jgi:putative transposase